MGTANNQCQKPTSRLVVKLAIAPNDLDPSQTTLADSNFLFLQNWQGAAIRRIHNTAADGLDGRTNFDVATNTQYVNMLTYSEPEFEDIDGRGTTGRRIRKYLFECVTRDSVTVT